MQKQTLDLLQRLEATDWFVNVGSQKAPDVVSVSNWKQAIKMSRSAKSRNLFLEGQNLLTQQLHDNFPARYHGTWNETVIAVNSITDPLVLRKIQKYNKYSAFSESDVKAVMNAAQWIIMAACMEQEFADCVPPAWELEWAEWYVQGHFPCGWEGNFPENGRLIVF